VSLMQFLSLPMAAMAYMVGLLVAQCWSSAAAFTAGVGNRAMQSPPTHRRTMSSPDATSAPLASAQVQQRMSESSGALCAMALMIGAALARRSQCRSQLAGRPTGVGRGFSVTTRKATLTTMLEEEEDTAVEEDLMAQDSATVKKTSVLILGATGTLGRQVVRQFLNAGYSVRCMIRNRADRPFSFLVDWGATVIEGSLARPETLPTSLIGIHTVIDCAGTRPEESIYTVEWEGKRKFIQCCEKMKVQRYVFISIKDCDAYDNVPLMQIKTLTEQFLAKTGIRTTILRVSGYMQPLISQYATNILDDQQVWCDDGSNPGVAYIDSQDCARMIAAAANKERTVGKTLTLTGPKVWSSTEIVNFCERLSGKEAEVNVVGTAALQATMLAAGSFEWSIDIAERLRFVEVNSSGTKGRDALMTEDTYRILGIDPNSLRKLDEYIGEYYRRVFKKLTEGKYEPEEGEVEREQAEAAEKLQKAMAADDDDKLPPGQKEEEEVSVLYQRDMADKLQRLFEDRILEKNEGQDNQWFGLTPLAETFNGRAAMFGFSLGLFTEWATNVSVAKQIDLLLALVSSPS